MVTKLIIMSLLLASSSGHAAVAQEDECAQLEAWEMFYKAKYDAAHSAYESFPYDDKWMDLQNGQYFAMAACQNDAICIQDAYTEFQNRFEALTEEYNSLIRDEMDAYWEWWGAQNRTAQAGC